MQLQLKRVKMLKEHHIKCTMEILKFATGRLSVYNKVYNTVSI